MLCFLFIVYLTNQYVNARSMISKFEDYMKIVGGVDSGGAG